MPPPMESLGREQEFVIKRYSECDLSQIDMKKLKEKFKEAPHKNLEIRDLTQLLEAKVNQMVHQNSERQSFAERLQRILDDYNAGSQTSQESMDELLRFMSELTEEQQRAHREGLTEQELEIYDMLLKPKLSKKDEQQVKLAAKDLLEKLEKRQSELFPLQWHQNNQKKKQVFVFVGNELNQTLPQTYDNDVFVEKKEKIYSALLMRGDAVTQMFAE